MATINTAKDEEILQLIHARGASIKSTRTIRKLLIDILLTDAKWSEEDRPINGNLLISAVHEIEVFEFGKWCRERGLIEDTLRKLLDNSVFEIRAFRSLNKEDTTLFNIIPNQRSLIDNIIKTEFKSMGDDSHGCETITTHGASNIVGLEVWKDKSLDFVNWWREIEWKLKMRGIDQSKWVKFIFPLLNGRALEKAQSFIETKPNFNELYNSLSNGLYYRYVSTIPRDHSGYDESWRLSKFCKKEILCLM